MPHSCFPSFLYLSHLLGVTEEWAVMQGATEMQLVTASVGAKVFYSRLQYLPFFGEVTGSKGSQWMKGTWVLCIIHMNFDYDIFRTEIHLSP